MRIPHGIDVELRALTLRESRNCTLVLKLDAADPGMMHVGSSSATDAKKSDRTS